MRTGAPWREMPKRYPPYQTCHRRFQEWVRSGTFEAILRALVQDMKKRGELDLSECFIDGTFVIAKKGGSGVGKTKRGKGTKIMVVAERSGLAVAISLSSASPHEITLVEATLEARFTEELLERLIGDKANDSDPLDEKLAEYGVELIAPHRSNRKKKTQDGRKLRRYRRRWEIECLFAWLQNYRRILVRFERLVENYIGFVHLGCLVYYSDTIFEMTSNLTTDPLSLKTAGPRLSNCDTHARRNLGVWNSVGLGAVYKLI